MYDLAKAILLGFSSFVLYMSISKAKVSAHAAIFAGAIFLGTPALAALFPSSYIPEPYKTIMLVLICSVFLLFWYNENLENVLAYTAMAYALSILLYEIALIPAFFISYILLEAKEVTAITSALVVAFSLFFLLPTAWLIRKKVKRLKLSRQAIIMGLGIIVTAVIFYSVARDEGISNRSLAILIIGFVFFSLMSVLSLWWVTKTQEKEHELKLLKEWQHRDSSRLPAIEKVLKKMIDTGDIPAAKQMLEELKIANSELSEERVKDTQLEKALPSTGMMLLDAVLEHMLETATEKGIAFHFSAAGNLKGIKKQVNQTQLTRLFSDLIKNAIVAVEHADGEYKEIRVYFRKTQDGYALSVQDRGIPFEVKVLSHLGVRAVTTYAEKGGSGIGYKTIFETLRSCAASLIITEYDASSKKVEVNFNGKNELIYRSYRAAELREACARTKNGAIVEGEEHALPQILPQLKGNKMTG